MLHIMSYILFADASYISWASRRYLFINDVHVRYASADEKQTWGNTNRRADQHVLRKYAS
jgi:hypothetical protein